VGERVPIRLRRPQLEPLALALEGLRLVENQVLECLGMQLVVSLVQNQVDCV